jgi:hypothetical protein
MQRFPEEWETYLILRGQTFLFAGYCHSPTQPQERLHNDLDHATHQPFKLCVVVVQLVE